MRFSTNSLATVFLLAAATAGSAVTAFSSPAVPGRSISSFSSSAASVRSLTSSPLSSSRTRLYNTPTPEDQAVADDEIERLKAMAQKLRAEAASLEAERAEELAQATQHVFDQFDKNQDGEIGLDELKAGLEKGLKTELSDTRVKMIMDEFDKNQDGKLQLNEMVSMEQFKSRLEKLTQEEKRLAKEAKIQAQREAEVAKVVEAQLEMFNDKEPTATDKVLSILPYLFPLLDSLQWGRFLLTENADNPFVVILALLYAAYRAIPFSGFASFLALNVLSSNLRINKLIRFNMQQAIFLDIALFFPGLLGAAFSLAGGSSIPPAITELGSDVVFGALLVTVLYASVSSLLGITPDKIPLVSQAVLDRTPTVDMIEFDDKGQMLPPNRRDEDGDDKNKKND
mmetsp:Transcript_39820/g.96108  ORF Transcript_39820/g.96108 Transcript_39820/m.96108 type:complete len:398 (+) Transcript_39820:398-1591(+)